jgi:putative flippase GtrA
MKFLLYCLCGGIGVSTDYLIYSLAVTMGFWYQSANILGYLSGTLISFFLNRKITFGVHNNLVRRLVIFLSVAVIGFLSSALLLWLMVDVISVYGEISKLVILPGWFIQNSGADKLDAKIAKLLTLPIVVIIQFSLNRRITFNENM